MYHHQRQNNRRRWRLSSRRNRLSVIREELELHICRQQASRLDKTKILKLLARTKGHQTCTFKTIIKQRHMKKAIEHQITISKNLIKRHL